MIKHQNTVNRLKGLIKSGNAWHKEVKLKELKDSKTFFSSSDFTYYKYNHVCFTLNSQIDKATILDIDIKGIKGRAFVDSGCTFNAVSSDFAKKCEMEIINHDKDIVCTVGGGKLISIKRRITNFEFENEELGRLYTSSFVMDPIPLGCDMILGMEFLKQTNPIINWNTGKATKRTNMNLKDSKDPVSDKEVAEEDKPMNESTQNEIKNIIKNDKLSLNK